MFNRKSFFSVAAFAMLGFFYASDAFATCARVLNSQGDLLGCALIEPYPPDVKLCSCSTATTTVKTNLDHHQVELLVGDQEPLSFSLGEVKSTGEWVITPGQASGNFTATYTMTDQTCSGSYSGPLLDSQDPPPGMGDPHFPSGPDLGSGQCNYSEQWEVPVVTCIGDSNLGHGNDCLGFDPDNTGKGSGSKGKGGKNAAVRVNQSCTESPNSTPERPKSLMTYKAFCEGEVPDEGRGVGSTKYLGGPDDPPPALFTNSTQAGVDAGESQLQNGGFPTFELNGEILVDAERCAALFPADPDNGLEVSQVLLLQEEWLGECPPNTTTRPPTEDQSTPTLCDVDPNAEGCAGHIFFQYPRVVQAISRTCTSDLGGEWKSAMYGPEDPDLQFGGGAPGDGFDNRGPLPLLMPNVDRICPR
jgi:hypothetical protein